MPVTEPSLDVLESLMAAAWPAVECSTADGWVLRSAGGVTQRANSIWPAVANRNDTVHATALAARLRHAGHWYAERRQPVIFQLTRREENAALESLLDDRGYSRQSESIIMVVPPALPAGGMPAAVPEVFAMEIAHAPSEEWLELWWRVDGRGGEAEKATARQILTAAPSLYVTARNSDGVAVGTGRLSLVEGWGGIYAMATHPDFRRQGVATAVLSALRQQAAESGVEQLWLLVTAANQGAQALYQAAGFNEAARYHYRQAPLRRAFGAC